MLSRSRRGIQSDRYAKKRRTKIILLYVLCVIAVVAIIAGLSFLSKANFLKITSVQVTGTNLISSTLVQTIAESSLTGNWWGLFARDSIFLYPKETIRRDILDAFPPVATVDFSHTGFHMLDVNVTERTPFALACTAGQCSYMDATGFVYAPAPQFSSGVYVDYAVIASSTASSTDGTIGTYITDPADFSVAEQATDFFTGEGLTVASINVPAPQSSGNAPGDFEIFLKKPASALARANSPAASLAPSATSTASSTLSAPLAQLSPVIGIYFNATSEPLEKTFEYFAAFWNHEPNKNFQYIDLRYGKDIVFKMD